MAVPLMIPALDDAARAELAERFNAAEHPETRLRYQMVLLSAQGHDVSEIATMTLRSHDTVTRVLHRYQEGGPDAVPRRSPPGRAPTVTPAWEAELVRVVELDPHEVGVESATWSTRLLADYLAAHTGLRLGQEVVRVYLHRHGFVCKRPTWTMERKAQEQADYQGNASGWRLS
jgi:transposase